MHGGITFFRGSGSSATAYLESDHHRADEYYLEDGSKLAARYVYGAEAELLKVDSLDSERYGNWVDWIDPDTGEVRGKPKGQERLNQTDGVIRERPASPRFAEMTVNCDKSLSVAAALSSDVSAALDAAQNEAAQAMSEYVAQNAVTRVGPMGSQRLVRVERFEAAAVVHKTSRAGDPHRHIHLQWNTRVFAEGKWRGLWTTPTLKQQGVLRGIGESVMRSNKELREALAAAGFTFDAATGTVVQLQEHAALLSKRHAQVEQNVRTLESRWREEHPGMEPSPQQRREWDFKAWAMDRPQKRTNQKTGTEAGWLEELQAAGLPVEGFTAAAQHEELSRELSELDPETIAAEAVTRCEAKASAWSIHDLQAAVAAQTAESDVSCTRAELNAFVSRVARLAAYEAPSISDPRDGYMPDHVRHITSRRVIAIEDELRARFAQRVSRGETARFTVPVGFLSAEQLDAAQIIASDTQFGVIEGAAGSGKTTVLRAAKEALDANAHQMLVLSPTLKGAQEAAEATQAPAFSVHKLLHAHGFRWDEYGRYSRLSEGQVDPATGNEYHLNQQWRDLSARSRIVVDEAGMLDHDTALALTQLADQYDAGLILMGDRAQLPAVGRGGVLDRAAKVAISHADIETVHRFSDPAYAALSIRMRTRKRPAALFDALYDGGHIRIHASTEEALAAMAADATETIRAGGTVALAAPTNEAATEINRHMQNAMGASKRSRRARYEIVASDGLTLRHGDRIMTRHNDSQLGVANRNIYTVKNTHKDGSITVTSEHGAEPVRLSADYVSRYVHLGYASTEYGAQGATETAGAGLLNESSTAAGAYVAATRGRDSNTLHLVAGSTDAARNHFMDILRRDRADRGIEAARMAMAREIQGLDLSNPPIPAVAGTAEEVTMSEPRATTSRLEAEQLNREQQQLRNNRQTAEIRRYENRLGMWQTYREDYIQRYNTTPDQWHDQHDQALARVEQAQERRDDVIAQSMNTAERSLREDHARAAADVNARHQGLAEAGLLGRRAASAQLEAALDRYQHQFGVRPAAPVQVEPSREQIAQTRDAAAAQPSAEVQRAEAMLTSAREAVSALEPQKIDRIFTEAKRPQPPTVGTPEQEAAKDRAFAGRQGQNKRARTQENSASPAQNAAATPEKDAPER